MEPIAPRSPSMNGHEPVEAISAKELMLLKKFRQARRLAQEGHRSRMEIMFYDNGRSCDITIEDRERVVEKPSENGLAEKRRPVSRGYRLFCVKTT